MKRVFSGVQPTGNIHLGNYLGALKQFVELQDENECIYCIVDLHSITVPQDPKELRKNILDVAALYLSIGIDPKKSTVFVQSDVSGHSELSWILTCNSYTGELSRMTQFKDKSKGRESAPTGLFTYPILMAADILLYDTDIVPVGNDQKQHIEICRDIAIRVNNKYKDEDKKIKKSIMRATTDSDGEIRFDPENKPGVSNLLSIYSALSGKSIENITADFAGCGYGDFKKELVEVTKEALLPIKKNFNDIRETEELKNILRAGAEKANTIAEKTIKRVKNNFGLGF